ncbi:ferritin-like domain-containing protein [Ramlibacter albus]|uniref:Ferritin-like domain-containing protein n=1 Tax=Ramlibacter albus TaxID=2079448 RepID=A0A923M8R5_9BURK|nr:ferritin-like domain-containing protein [Ramlibacter albus]MBC5766377.1 ferritin-like domain-containing protein [Ramlibacter albus]
MELRQQALQVLCSADPGEKVRAARELGTAAASLPVSQAAPAATLPVPGRPQRPALVHAARVPKRSPFKPEGLAALLHAIAHIEFNAINLAADAAWRFDGMPREFHLDWVRVMAEEAYHFTLLQDHLRTLGYDYGDFDAHDGLWAMCEKTKDDVVARMALVPRTLEARGLDATPQIQEKLRNVGTPAAMRAVEILDVILRDEVGHVAIGNRWYRWLCEREGYDPVAHYGVVAAKFDAPRLYPPFNEEARLRAGFTNEEFASLSSNARDA